ncbi:MAG: ATP-binding cassette domain-containing protein, partial [Dictyoglomaceae bacterium]
MEGIEKSFPGVHALRGAKFELRAGEVHALVGENGAGKSTLMKILTGVYKKDGGKIFYKGKEVDILNPRQAQEMGISIVYQDLNLMPHLTVSQNIFIGREPKRKNFPLFLDEVEINRKTKELLDMLHMKIDPKTKVSNLTVGKQQMVEIAKALSFNAEVLIF